jgi:squalene-hopene/tetraprenyl-beta-curcumene cyclase
MKKWIWVVCSAMLAGGVCAEAPKTEAPAEAVTETVTLTANMGSPEVSESLTREAQAAIDRGMQWLLDHQQEDGHWSNTEFPALTALPLWALVRGGCEDQDAINKAVDFILGCVHEDGAIYRTPKLKRKGGGLKNYNTAVCMVALHATGQERVIPVVQKAREYLAGTQHLGGDIYAGGMGYDADTGRAYTDLSNSYLAYEAMRLTEDVEDLRTDGERADLDWEAARKFIQRVHNDPDFNKEQTWANEDPDEKGGFVYRPDQTRAGEVTDEEGVVKYRSMPGMTYAGMLSYIYADVDRTDPRVVATADWAANHFDLEVASRNPEKLGTDRAKEGLFYLYNVMTKGLAAYGRDVFTPREGSMFNWRVKMIEQLLRMQKIDPDNGAGYWINNVGRYWESDPVLVTAYALLSLEIATP